MRLFGERYAPTLTDWLVSAFLVALAAFTLAGCGPESREAQAAGVLDARSALAFQQAMDFSGLSAVEPGVDLQPGVECNGPCCVIAPWDGRPWGGYYDVPRRTIVAADPYAETYTCGTFFERVMCHESVHYLLHAASQPDRDHEHPAFEACGRWQP